MINKHSKYTDLIKEIHRMAYIDQNMRKGKGYDSEIDRKNTEQIKHLISVHGWPKISMVGVDAAKDFWLLVQHTNDIEFQMRAFELMNKAVENNEADKKLLAYLYDRVRINSGLPQLFGTQFYKDENGRYGPKPIEDIEHLEERRKQYGMEAFSKYEKKMIDIFNKPKL